MSRTAAFSRTSARRCRGARDQAPDLKAWWASCTVVSTSSLEAEWQWVKTDPVAGSSIGMLMTMSVF